MKLANGKLTLKIKKSNTIVQKRLQWFSTAFLIFSVILLQYLQLGYLYLTTDYILVTNVSANPGECSGQAEACHYTSVGLLYC